MELTILEIVKMLAIREAEIRQAVSENPGMEMGAAYKKWKTARGESPVMLSTAVVAGFKKDLMTATAKLKQRPCSVAGCPGIQRLEGVCSGCIEGQAGYKSKWTCPVCLHRDLSKEDLNAWIIKLSSA